MSKELQHVGKSEEQSGPLRNTYKNFKIILFKKKQSAYHEIRDSCYLQKLE